jgi:hypothetical protein
MDKTEARIYSALNSAIDEIKPDALEKIINLKEYSGEIKAVKKPFHVNRIAVSAACIVLIAIGIFSFNNLPLSMRKTNASMMGGSAYSNDMAATASPISGSAKNDNGLNTTAASDGSVTYGSVQYAAASNVTQAANSRKIIKSASVTLQTTDYDKSLSSLKNLISQYGGFIQNSNELGTKISADDSSNRGATYTVRVPSDKLDTFLNSVGGIGTLVSKNIQGQDVSQNYFDTQARLKTLKAEEARILDILNKTGNMADLLAAEKQLTEVQTQIEQLTGELTQMDSLIDLSTVTISLAEVKQITLSPANNIGGQISTAFSNSIKALEGTGINIMIVIVYILPFAFVLALIAALIVAIIKLKKKSRFTPRSKT